MSKRLFEAYSEWDRPSVRVDRTREGFELILKLWTEKAVDYDGNYYKAKGAVLEPKPVQKPHPPMLFGGAGRRMLKLAGRYADICYIPPWNRMSREEAREIVLSEARFHDRVKRVSFAYAYTPLGPTERYDIKEYGNHVERAAKNGFEFFITAFPMDAPPWEGEASSREGIQNYLKRLRDFATKFISSYSS